MSNSAAKRRPSEGDRTRRIVAAIGLLCEGLPGKSPTAVTFRAYELGLSDLPVEAVEEAAMRALRVCDFVPSVKELRKLCGVMTTDVRTVKAWDSLNEAMRKHNFYHSLLFDDPALNATCHNFGGWIALSERWGDQPAEEWDKWFRKDFERVYAGFFTSRQWGENGTRLLVGWYDQRNTFDGKSSKDYLVEFKTDLPPLLCHKPAASPKRWHKTTTAPRSGHSVRPTEIEVQ